MKRLPFFFVLTLVLAALWTGSAASQDPIPTPSDDDVNRVARQMFCPVCENTPLDVCPTTACAQWRALIRQKLSEGWTDAQIKDYFVEQYGVRVLAEPPASGLNWLVYIIPPALFLIGVFIVFRAFQSMRKTAQVEINDVDAAAPSGDDYLQRVEEELKKRN